MFPPSSLRTLYCPLVPLSVPWRERPVGIATAKHALKLPLVPPSLVPEISITYPTIIRFVRCTDTRQTHNGGTTIAVEGNRVNRWMILTGRSVMVPRFVSSGRALIIRLIVVTRARARDIPLRVTKTAKSIVFCGHFRREGEGGGGTKCKEDSNEMYRVTQKRGI